MDREVWTHLVHAVPKFSKEKVDAIVKWNKRHNSWKYDLMFPNDEEEAWFSLDAGFNFENCKRNAMLAQQGFKPPKVKHKF